MTRNRSIVLALMCAFGAAGADVQAKPGLARQADIFKNKIVFTHEGDLWLAGLDGSPARRITRDGGTEQAAKFSPDGSQLAFTAQYDGDTDVYVMDVNGGVPKRLTFHPAADLVLGWWPDGKHVLFRSRREFSRRAERIYKISVDGGMPEKLPVDRAGLTAVSPDGKRIAYNRISRETRTWKRHQGGTAQDIWYGSLDKGDFDRITNWPGTDNYPMWHGNAIYYTSDRQHGTLNIFRHDLKSGEDTALTEYKNYDVKFPSIGPDSIIYQLGGTLQRLDLANGKVTDIPIDLSSDRVRMRKEFVQVAPKTGSFGLSPTGKRLVLAARGEILNVPVEDGEHVNLTSTVDSREKNAAWSPDGKWIAFMSDRTGEEEIFLVDQHAKEEPKQLTSGGFGFRLQPVWSPDSKWLLFSDKFLRLNLVDAASGKITVVDQGEYDDGWYRWGIQDYVWSLDSAWIAYTKLEESGNEAIFLYSVANKSIHRVTDDVFPDWSPSFDPEGRYLYFLSNRNLAPIMGMVEQNYVFLDMALPFVVMLQDGEPSPFAPKDSEEEGASEDDDSDDAKKDDDKKDKDKKDKDEDDDKKSANPDPVKIDLDGIGRRILRADGVKPGNYFRLEATDKGFLYLKKNKHEFEKYQTVTDSTGGKLDLYHYDLEEAETEKVLGGIANYHLSADGEKLVYRAGDEYGVVDAGKKADVGDGQVSFDNVRIVVDRSAEYLQIFNEAWRVQRDFFYDPNMHGVDWEAMREKYRALVYECGERTDLTYLIGEMIAELNIGHTYSFGGDVARNARNVGVGLLGAKFTAERGSDYFRISHIYPGTSWKPSERSPLAEPGCPVKVGDYLIAIDGQTVTTKDNVYAFLQDKEEVVVTITYNDQPNAKDAKHWRLKTLRSENAIMYREWVDRNRAYVDKASDGQLGYLHIPNMGRTGLMEFGQYFFSHHYKKGFVIDERYNGGGFTSSMIIDRLEREMWALTKPREGKPVNDPERAFAGPMIIVVNEDTGSSGEWFAEQIKVKGLAPILGMRTWGGAVGIELHQPLVDGGGTTPPQFGPYGLDRRWLIEGHGVVPDIEVQNMPGGVLRGKDTQLDAAINHLLDELRKNPVVIPDPPPYPDKSKKAGQRSPS